MGLVVPRDPGGFERERWARHTSSGNPLAVGCAVLLIVLAVSLCLAVLVWAWRFILG